MIYFYILTGGVFAVGFIWLFLRACRKNVFLWLPGYVKGEWAGWRERHERYEGDVVHVLFCIADHFEPGWGRPGPAVELKRVEKWVRKYPRVVEPFRDGDGCPPRHTFFFPAEEYRPELLTELKKLVSSGYGEVEVHLHHDDDTADELKASLNEFLERLDGHGLLERNCETGRPSFAFVHGNWALDNSRPDGRWCGVNNELQVLQECGCFADFTLPSAPSPTQTRRINSIYYACDDPDRPKSHDDGVEVEVGGQSAENLMLIQGPLCVGWRGLRFASIPRIENGDLSAGFPPTPRRAKDWLRAGVCVSGRPDVVCVKVHTHGCQEANAKVLLGKQMKQFHKYLTSSLNEESGYKLHYVTAREMYNIVKSLEGGFTGDPGECRDYAIFPPECVRINHRKRSRTEACID